MVLLSALPCSDEFEEYSFTQNATLNVAHDVDAGKMESCFPICACICCGKSMVEIDVVNFAIKVPLSLLDKHTSADNFRLQQRNRNIWHPPKLA